MGKELRQGRLFREDQRSVVVALDHGAIIGPKPGLERISSIIEAAVRAKPDALIVTAGIVARYAGLIEGKTGLILSIPQTNDIKRSIGFASRLGVDAVKLFVAVGDENERQNLVRLWDSAIACYDAGIPLVAEMYPLRGAAIPNPVDAGVVAKYARIGMEYGADVIKTFYTGSVESFRKVTGGCPAPVLILGGEKGSASDLMSDVKGALKGGAAGVAVGRNIWQADNPTAITESLVRIVHGKEVTNRNRK